MTEKIRILFLSANPWTTSRILVDEEAREIFEKLQEGTHRDMFELYKHAAIRPIDLQRLLMMYEPHIVHFSGHGSKTQKIILGGTPGRGKEVDRQGLVEVFALYKNHLRLVLLNACFTRTQARFLSEVIDYSVGTGKGIGDKGGVAFAGAFYRALGFGKSVKEAFESAKAELGLTKMPRTKGIELFVRNGISENDAFPQTDTNRNSKAGEPWRVFPKHLIASHSDNCHRRPTLLHTCESHSTIFEPSRISRPTKWILSEVECFTSLYGLADVSSTHARLGSYEFVLTSHGGEVSIPDLKSSRQVKRVKSANPSPTKDGPESRSAKLYLYVYVARIVKFRRVLVTNDTDVSHPQTEVKTESIVLARTWESTTWFWRAPRHSIVEPQEYIPDANCCESNATNDLCASSITSEGSTTSYLCRRLVFESEV